MRTYVMLKPDSIERGLIGKIITQIEERGYEIEHIRRFNLTRDILDVHYSHLTDKPFYPEIIAFMTRGPVIGMVIQGENVIDGIRDLVGPTDYREASPDTIRGQYANSIGENLIHASDSNQAAVEEIKRFFDMDI